jgi:hypothetical protein
MNSSVGSIAKDLYLSTFVLFYRLNAGQWPARMNADTHKAVVTLSFIDFLLVFSAVTLFRLFTGHETRLNPWVGTVSLIPILMVNYYYLVIRGHGLAFERKFDKFHKQKRTILRAGAICVVVAVFTGFFLSVEAYHRALGI